ncbi:MAG: hypothetical protein HGA44_05625, partial [Cellulomonadaceae bacterium]|nr:hypothetical protein [Cellulomonadaceae bacterium]
MPAKPRAVANVVAEIVHSFDWHGPVGCGFPAVILAYFYIIANPYEEAEDLLETIRLFARLPYPFYSQVYNLVFFPGTVLFDHACRDRLIEGKADSGYELDYKAGL